MTAESNSGSHRIEFLDGLRGVAILLVISFHAFSRWTSLVPYGDRFATFIIFKKGGTGVQLFFLISGFVILMTLEKSKVLREFLYKRWLRLFPGMLIASLLIFVSGLFLPGRPLGVPDWKSVIPGLTFIEPRIITLITNIGITDLEGSFWSLYVEVKFYILFGVLFFSVGKYRAVWGVLILYTLWLIIKTAQSINVIGNLGMIDEIIDYLSLRHFGWFATGAFAYLYYKAGNRRFLHFALFACVLSLVPYFGYLDSLIVVSFLAACFFGAVYYRPISVAFTNRTLLFFGFISYPLYLIHENAIILLIVRISSTFPSIPHFFLPIVAIAPLSLVAFFIARYAEPWLRRALDRMITSLSPLQKPSKVKST